MASIEGRLGRLANLRGSRVLITGGAGFLGGRLTAYLSRLGVETTVLDLPEAISKSRLPKGVKLERASLLEFDGLRNIVKDHEAIIHLAAVSDVNQAMRDPRGAFMITDVGTQNILEAVRLANSDPLFLLSSSFTVYKMPPDYIPIDEGHPKWPGTPYAFTKICQEELCSVYADIYGLRQCCVRLSPFFGPGQGDTNVMLFMKRAMRNETFTIEGGAQTRDWNFVDNAVYGILLAISKRRAGAYNIGGGTETSILELVTTIKKMTGSNSEVVTKPYRKGESASMRVLLDLKKAEKELGYEVVVPFTEGLVQLRDYIRGQVPSA